MQTKKKYYVAYGSNLNLAQMKERCPDAKVIGSGVIEGYRLTYRGHNKRGGVANVEPCPGTDVPVGVFAITKKDEKSLDRYEGWPHLYRKETVKVRMPDGDYLNGMIYIMNEGYRLASPSEYYYNVISEGYDNFGFSKEFLRESLNSVPESTPKINAVNTDGWYIFKKGPRHIFSIATPVSEDELKVFIELIAFKYCCDESEISVKFLKRESG